VISPPSRRNVSAWKKGRRKKNQRRGGKRTARRSWPAISRFGPYKGKKKVNKKKRGEERGDRTVVLVLLVGGDQKKEEASSGSYFYCDRRKRRGGEGKSTPREEGGEGWHGTPLLPISPFPTIGREGEGKGREASSISSRCEDREGRGSRGGERRGGKREGGVLGGDLSCSLLLPFRDREGGKRGTWEKERSLRPPLLLHLSSSRRSEGGRRKRRK